MRRLATAAGVDYDQWKALTLVALKLDFRQGRFGRSRTGEARQVAILVTQAVVYSMYGLFMAIVIWATHDLFLAGTALMTYVTFMVGTTVLLEHNSVLTSPQDYAILGFRPVTSRTYFAARLANVLVYTTAHHDRRRPTCRRSRSSSGTARWSASRAWPRSTGARSSRRSPILFGYGWLMHVIGADTLKRALSYVQLVMSFAIYGGYMLMSRVVSVARAAIAVSAEIRLDGARAAGVVCGLPRRRVRERDVARVPDRRLVAHRTRRARERPQRAPVDGLLRSTGRDRLVDPEGASGARRRPAGLVVPDRRGARGGGARAQRSSGTISDSAWAC